MNCLVLDFFWITRHIRSFIALKYYFKGTHEKQTLFPIPKCLSISGHEHLWNTASNKYVHCVLHSNIEVWVVCTNIECWMEKTRDTLWARAHFPRVLKFLEWKKNLKKKILRYVFFRCCMIFRPSFSSLCLCINTSQSDCMSLCGFHFHLWTTKNTQRTSNIPRWLRLE